MSFWYRPWLHLFHASSISVVCQRFTLMTFQSMSFQIISTTHVRLQERDDNTDDVLNVKLALTQHFIVLL